MWSSIMNEKFVYSIKRVPVIILTSHCFAVLAIVTYGWRISRTICCCVQNQCRDLSNCGLRRAIRHLCIAHIIRWRRSTPVISPLRSLRTGSRLRLVSTLMMAAVNSCSSLDRIYQIVVFHRAIIVCSSKAMLLSR